MIIINLNYNRDLMRISLTVKFNFSGQVSRYKLCRITVFTNYLNFEIQMGRLYIRIY